MKVLVVGGGITGSVAATALAQRGVEVDLVEIVPEWKGTGHGITLQGNALRSFREIGVWDRVRALGFCFDRVRLSRADGSPIVELTTPRTGGPDLPATMGALRSALQEVLSEAVYAAGVTVRLGLTVRAMPPAWTWRSPMAHVAAMTWSSALTASSRGYAASSA
jgi:2-polyprenyl-6-methoxyphenol hydroxylase-like FAD-dependent oxidoreductase